MASANASNAKKVADPMDVRTRNEWIALNAAEQLARALARQNGTPNWRILLRAALLQAEELAPPTYPLNRVRLNVQVAGVPAEDL